MTPTLFHNLCNFRSQRRWWLTEEKQAHFYNYFLEFAATHPKKKKKIEMGFTSEKANNREEKEKYRLLSYQDNFTCRSNKNNGESWWIPK